MVYSHVNDAAPALAAALEGKRHPLLITHVNPDGDAVGSVAGLGLALEARGHQVTLLTPTVQPPFVRNIPAANRIQDFSANPRLPADVDMIVLVDTGDLRRIGRVWENAREYVLARPIVVVDHHVTNTGEGIVNFVDPSRSSTCELLYELLRAWDVTITPAIATALLFGIWTDTQSFRTSNTTPAALRTAADLLECGADRALIVRDVYNSVAVSTAQLMGLALSAMQQEGPIVWASVSQEMYRATGADDDAAAEVTDYLATLGDFQISAMFKERKDGKIKVSLRSLPPIDVSSIAKQFGGGGHRQAAGFELDGPLPQAEERVIPALRALLDGA